MAPGLQDPTLVGDGLRVRMATMPAAGTIPDKHLVTKFDATSGPMTCTLPPASSVPGQVFLLKKVDSTANVVTIAASGTDTIDGASSKRFTRQYQAMTLISDGTNWQATFPMDPGVFNDIVISSTTQGQIVFPDSTGKLIGSSSLIWDNAGLIIKAPNAQFSGSPWIDVKYKGAKGDGTTDDTAAIQSALNAIGSSGGIVFFPPGTYKISTTLTLPGVNLTLLSCGGTVISIGTNAIAAFTYSGSTAATINFIAQGLNIQGNIAGNTAGQVAFDLRDTGSAGVNLVLLNTVINCVETAFYDRGILAIYLNGGSGISVNTSVTSNYYNGPIGNSGNGQIFATDTFFISTNPAVGGGGFANKPTVYAKNCTFQCPNGMDTQDMNLTGCKFTINNGASANLTYAGIATKITTCDFTNNYTLVCNGASGFITSTLFNGTNPTRNVDIAAGASSTKFVNCQFSGGTSEAIRTASTGGKFANSIGLKVTETGAANSNEYLANTGMSGSTILGASDGIMGFVSGKLAINQFAASRMVDILDASNPQLRLTQAAGSKYADLQADSNGHLFLLPQSTVVRVTSGGALRTGTAGNSYFFDIGTLNIRNGDGTTSGAALVVNGTGQFAGDLTVSNSGLLKVPNGLAMRMGTNGGTYFLDLGTVTFRDGTGTTGGSVIMGGNANIGGTSGQITFFNGTLASKQTRGATFTNNITVGGTTDSPANWTDLTTYANDAAAIRNFCYQVARVLNQYDVALRAYGLLT